MAVARKHRVDKRPLPDARQFLRAVLDKIADGVYYTDIDRRIRFWNQAAELLTGFRAVDVVGSRCSDNILNHVDETGKNLCENDCPLSDTIADGQPRQAHVFFHHKDGHRIPVCVRTAVLRDSRGRVVGAVETFTDDTTHVADLLRIRQLEEVAFLDELTHLANRRHLNSSLDIRMAESVRHGHRFGVILADVDCLKRINDEHGHDTGDRMLQVVANTLAHNCRPYDIVGRWGGDEFLVIASHTATDGIDRLAERLRALVDRSSLAVSGVEISLAISVGATAVRPGEELCQMLKRADDLLYRSKAAGRNRVAFEP